MKLKLDLHPIYNDTHTIESELARVIDEAVSKRATEVEIIPGKGSGALKKSVLRYLDRPDVKQRYHRVEKDSDNWGRLFVHFRHERTVDAPKGKPAALAAHFSCTICEAESEIPAALIEAATESAAAKVIACDACGTPNRVTIWRDRGDKIHCKCELGYE